MADNGKEKREFQVHIRIVYPHVLATSGIFRGKVEVQRMSSFGHADKITLVQKIQWVAFENLAKSIDRLGRGRGFAPGSSIAGN